MPSMTEEARTQGPNEVFEFVRPEWQAKANCLGSDPVLFFPVGDDPATIDAAKAVCVTCPVRKECLEYALTTRQDDGIWGGLDEEERKRMRKARSAERKNYTRPTGY